MVAIIIERQIKGLANQPKSYWKSTSLVSVPSCQRMVYYMYQYYSSTKRPLDYTICTNCTRAALKENADVKLVQKPVTKLKYVGKQRSVALPTFRRVA